MLTVEEISGGDGTGALQMASVNRAGSRHAAPRPAGGTGLDHRVLRALVRLASEVTGSRAAGDLLEAVAETALTLLEADSLSISRVDRPARILRTMINVGHLGAGEVRRPHHEVYRIDDFPDTLGFLVDRPVRRVATRVDDPAGEPAEIELLRSLGKHSSLKTAIVVDGVVWGELWASRTEAMAPFTEYDADVAEVIVGLVSAGLAQVSAWEQMQHLALTDPMTGLGNRRLFDEHLDRFLTRSVALGRPLAVALGDVNGLKHVNDRLGHAAGDDALRRVATASLAAIRDVPDAVSARLGGDEFALVLPGLDTAQALAVAASWCAEASDPQYGTSLACGVSVTTPGSDRGRADLMRAADLAAYAAKRRGSPLPVEASRYRPAGVTEGVTEAPV
jgi:diguanylate cyclase (GGDEF)-like protein